MATAPYDREVETGTFHADLDVSGLLIGLLRVEPMPVDVYRVQEG